MATSQNKQTFEDYEGFTEKFKPKKTSDDCFTPLAVYEAVEEWVEKEYGLDTYDFCRPFFPGGDFEQFDYTGRVVVDNPPFSILGSIIKFYVSREIKFFLFAPTLSGLVRYGDFCTVFPTGADITYDNGAVIATSFVTNLDPPEIRARTVPELYRAVTDANERNQAQKKRELPKYVYPPDVITSAQMYQFAQRGVTFVVRRAESERISKLDSMAGTGKSIFGCGWLLSEREKAEREKAERWQLSDREKEIIKRLSCS